MRDDDRSTGSDMSPGGTEGFSSESALSPRQERQGMLNDPAEAHHPDDD